MAAPQRTTRGPIRRFTRAGDAKCSVSIWFLLLSNLLVFQMTYFRDTLWSNTPNLDMILNKPAQKDGSSYILDFPRGSAVALPSIQVSKAENEEINRKHYGGQGDKKHLGGFTEIDLFGISPAVWKNMISYFGIKTLLDVGCGRGISTSWFLLHGVDALCVEGSHDAVQKSMLPDPTSQVVEHDFSRGPWWPPHTVDAIWCVEFLEHVGRNFHHNYLPAFRKAALIFVTHSMWGGWHHVEVHNEVWWISKFESYGFRYSQDLTNMVRHLALVEQQKNIKSITGEPWNAQHLWNKLMIFINPTVAAMPDHAHLFSEHGCYHNRTDAGHRECGTGGRAGRGETALPKSFYPLNLTDGMDKAWEELVKKNINVKAIV